MDKSFVWLSWFFSHNYPTIQGDRSMEDFEALHMSNFLIITWIMDGVVGIGIVSITQKCLVYIIFT